MAAVTGPGLVLTYRYTMVNVTNLTHDIPGVREYVANLGKQLRIDGCSDSGLRYLLVSGVTLIYAYRDANGATLGNIEVTEKDCGTQEL